MKRFLPPAFLLFLGVMSIFYFKSDLPAMATCDKIPVIMYHSVRSQKEGEYMIPFEKLESDLKYLKEKGYETMTCKEIKKAADKGESLPKKKVILTFDDGYLNNLTFALPLLEKYDMKAVIAVVGEFTKTYDDVKDENNAYACLNSEHIKELINSGRIEIANHSYSFHHIGARRGSMQIKGESDEHYKNAFCEDTKRCHDYILKNTGYSMTTYAYPYGAITKASLGFLKEMGCETVLTCEGRHNILSNETPLVLGRYNRDGRLSTSQFMERADIS